MKAERRNWERRELTEDASRKCGWIRGPSESQNVCFVKDQFCRGSQEEAGGLSRGPGSRMEPFTKQGTQEQTRGNDEESVSETLTSLWLIQTETLKRKSSEG